MADTAPHPDSLAAWAERIVADDSIKETGPIKGPAKMVMDLIDWLAADDDALAVRAADIIQDIGRMERDLDQINAERHRLAGVLRQMRAAPAEPVAKATRRRSAVAEPVAEVAE